MTARTRVGGRLRRTLAGRPHLTSRGRGAVALVLLSSVLGWRYGPRELNAVASPVAAVVLLGVVGVWRADLRGVELASPDPGTPGDTRKLVAEVDGSGLATLVLRLPDGVRGPGGDARLETTVSLPGTVEWPVDLSERGLYEVGPVRVRLRDPLGLVARTVRAPVTTEVVVHPAREPLDRSAGGLGSLRGLSDPARQEFAFVREYQPGDPVQQVDWKSSAKHDELHVVEFTASDGPGSVTVAGEAADGMADTMARLVATLVDTALEDDLQVGVAVPAGRVPPGSGPTHRRQVLRLLARTGPGETAQPGDTPDVVVRAGDPHLREGAGSRETTLRTSAGSHSLASGTDRREEGASR